MLLCSTCRGRRGKIRSKEEVELKKHVLPNGVRVLVDTCPWFRSVALTICLEGGLSDEPEGLVGVSHLLEHLLFKRTGRLDTRELAIVMDELGGDVNAFTDVSSICLCGVVPSQRLGELLDFFSELLLDAQFGEAELELEKDIIRQEILEANDSPAEVTYQALCGCLWPSSIYRFPVFGSLATVDRLSLDDVRARLKRLLSGKRMIVGVSGNIEPEPFFALVESRFGALPSEPWERPSVPKTASGVRLVSHPVRQVHLGLCQEFPSITDDDYLEGLIFAGIFGDGLSSRLFQLLREERGIAYDVSAHVEGVAQMGLFLTSIILERESVDEAFDLILDELKKVVAHSVTPDELARVKRSVSAQLEMESDSLSNRLWRMVESELSLGRFVSVEEVLDRIRRISIPDMETFISRRIVFGQSALALGGNIEGLTVSQRVLDYCGVPFASPGSTQE